MRKTSICEMGNKILEVIANEATTAAAKEFEENMKVAKIAKETKNVSLYYHSVIPYVVSKGFKKLANNGYTIDARRLEDYRQDARVLVWEWLTGQTNDKDRHGNKKRIWPLTWKEKEKTNEFEEDKHGNKKRIWKETGTVYIFEAWHEVPERLLFGMLAERVYSKMRGIIKADNKLNYNVTLESIATAGEDGIIEQINRKLDRFTNMELIQCLLSKAEYKYLREYVLEKRKANGSTYISMRGKLKQGLLNYTELKDVLEGLRYVDKSIKEETRQEMHNKALAKILRKIGG